MTEPCYVSGVYSQLKPKAWLDLLTSGSGVDPDLHYILDGVIHGFRVVDRTATLDDYYCKNYSSCFEENNLDKLRRVVNSECLAGKLSHVTNRPKCVHVI